MFILARAVTYSTLFIGFFLVFVPARVIGAPGLARPGGFGALQIGGMAIAAAGAAVAAACILTFVTAGRGTPAPFDPPRRLVVSGPYRLVRNPMYLGAGLAMTGAALFYESFGLLAYVVAFLAASHLLVIGYEEPTLRVTFGKDYERYCDRVGRWY